MEFSKTPDSLDSSRPELGCIVKRGDCFETLIGDNERLTTDIGR